MRLGQKRFDQTIGPKSLVKKKPKPALYHDEHQNAPQLAHERHKQCPETKLRPNHVPLPVFFVYYAIFFFNLPAPPCPPFENSARQVPVYLYDHPV